MSIRTRYPDDDAEEPQSDPPPELRLGVDEIVVLHLIDRLGAAVEGDPLLVDDRSCRLRNPRLQELRLRGCDDELDDGRAAYGVDLDASRARRRGAHPRRDERAFALEV